MALPQLTIPTYELQVPSTGKVLKYRPFLVKEEKILLMATESRDEKAMTQALTEIVTNCVLDKIDVNKLKIYDLEYIFLQLRSKSIGEVSELRYSCQNKLNKGKKTEKLCEAPIVIRLDLTTLEITKNPKHEPHIKLSDKVGLVLKDPEVSLLDRHTLSEIGQDAEQLFEVIAECVDHVYEGDQAFKPSDYKKEEIDAFLGSLTQKQFEYVKEYFDTMPKLEHTLHLNCKKCGNKSDLTLNGLSDFFM